MRVWKYVDGEPYMVNPRLGVLALQAMNPKGKKRRKNMARHYGSRHMAWVRSFKKNRHRKHRRHNPYPIGGAAASMLGNPRRRHRKHNPHRKHRRHNPPATTTLRGLGLPPLMPVVWGTGGFIGTAMVQGFVDTLVPASVGSAASSPMIKYGELLVSVVLVTWLSKRFISGGAAAFAAVGGGIYILEQAVRDFLPAGIIPGMKAYTPLKAYTPVRRSSTMGAIVETQRGRFPQLATPDGMPQLAGLGTMDQGFKNSADYAQDGSMNVIAERFRRL